MTTIGKLRVGQKFKIDERDTHYYIRGEYNKGTGRYSCRAFTKDHSPYTWMNVCLLKTRKVLAY